MWLNAQAFHELPGFLADELGDDAQRLGTVNGGAARGAQVVCELPGVASSLGVHRTSLSAQARWPEGFRLIRRIGRL